jgi:hypothetical protein
MTQIDLRIDKYMDGETLENGAMVQIRRLLGGADSRLVKEVPAPVGTDASRVQSVELEAGRYEFSAVLPSGSVTSRVVEVDPGQSRVPVVLDTEDSPHEWLSWQQWSGNASSAVSTEGLRSQMLSRSPQLQGALDQVTAEFWWLPASPALPSDPLWQQLSSQLGGLKQGASIDPLKIRPAAVVVQPIQLLRDPPYLAAKLPAGGNANGRAYLVVSNGNRSMLCAMPWPWPQTDWNGGLATVEAVIAIDEERIESEDLGTPDSDEDWSVRPGVRDRMMGGLIGYFAAGEEGTARHLLGPARDMLFGKVQNPLAAAAGAHILVGEWIRDSARNAGQAEWFHWVRNLRQWFPWLPDGALLDGWLALRRRDKEPQVEEARTALLEAERRGIPLYSIGVRRLVDGLLLVAGERRQQGKQDPEVEAALGRARQLAWQVDPRQAFTCIRMWSA